MLSRPKRLGVAVAGIATLAVVSVLPATPAQAEPKLADVKAQVDDLYHRAEAAQERVNDHQLRLTELNNDLNSLEADEARQSTKLESVRAQVRDSVVDQYQGQSISTVGEVAVSDDPSAFLAQLGTMESYNDLQDGLFSEYGTELEALDLRREATAERRDDIAKTTRQLKAEKAQIDQNLAEAKKVLGKLEAEQQAKLMAAESGLEVDAKSIAAEGRAATAIKFAMAQVGDRYVFGAAGMDAWDCSGLMMKAWGSAGVGLPHSSRMQAGMGTAVSRDALQPGDLIFYYSPVSHVGMYIGNGMIVHAANPRAGVKVSPIDEMPITGMRRVG